ncbi:interleukin-31 receptor subunit alpha [Python bivittatus]|uniref:Interleukin-31 receptor subunit alpha n=1 Tax=Python bivittatus TaxID=176946 RepID=A0A9F5MUV1_PYTBI|nr:interleukin-31 receptor subunit alpha [Python bivittatus]
MSSLPKMTQNKAFLSLLWILTMLCNFCLTALPQKPENISCIYDYNGTLSCSWTSGKETSSDTTYIINTSWYKSKDYTCEMKNGLCSVYNVPDGSYRIQVTAKNNFGEVASHQTLLHLREILKPGPPSIMKVEGMKGMLKVCWERHNDDKSFDPVTCQIQYQATTKNISSVINVQMGSYEREKCSNLTGLWNFTNYTVVVRCKVNESRFWSEWSKKATNRTEEQAPLKVDLWRVIETFHPNGNRSVHLLRKEHKEFPSSGIIVGYTVKYIMENNTTELKYNQNESVIFNLMGEACEISVIAHNSAGDSPEATIRIPSIGEESVEHQRIASLKASPSGEEMILTWDPTDSEINGYIIEWYDELETDPDKRSWDRITNITEWTSPKGIFKRHTCYHFSVYPLHKGEIKMPSSTNIYFYEGIPSIGPNAEVKNPGKNDAIIKWEEIPKSERNGVIINYTILYKAEDGKQLEETVNGSVLQYQLKSLQSNTRYRAQIRANTTAGGQTGKETYFVTKLFSITDIVFITVSIGIFMSCLLIVGLLWAVKYQMMKRICWPQIPRPVIASCPAASQKIILGNSPSEDDINILKTDTCSENELPLLNPEDCFKQADVTAKIMVAGQETFCTGEYKALECFLPVSSLKDDSKNQILPAVTRDSESYVNEEMPHQVNLKERTEFNPYLKNSVCTREFLDCENVEQNTKETETQHVPLACYIPNSTGHPYIATDAVKLFTKY